MSASYKDFAFFGVGHNLAKSNRNVESFYPQIIDNIEDGTTVTSYSKNPVFSGKVGSEVIINCPNGAPVFQNEVGSIIKITCKGEPIFEKGRGHHIMINDTTGSYRPS
jgi:hypothetical protein